MQSANLLRRLVLCAIVLGAAAPAARAQSPVPLGNVFEVRGVAVDVTAATAAAAREQALAEGEQKAFRRLLERLTLRTDRDRLPALSRSEIAAYVQDLAVAEEKTSAVRYIASLTYRFRPERVRRLLADHNLLYAETPAKPVVVLPVYQMAGALMLWDDPNPWRQAWATRPPVDTLAPLILPHGDLADIGAIGAEQAVAGDAQRLAAVATRYGANDAVVAHAVLGLDPRRGLPELEVYIARYGTAIQEQTLVKTYSAAAGEAVEAMLGRAAADIAAEIEDQWKRDNLLHLGRPGILPAAVRIGGLADWMDVRRRLARVAVVRRIDQVLLSRDEARINIHYVGEVEQLALALAQADLRLVEEAGEWVLAPVARRGH
jgi:hypothetical protein